MLQHIRSKTLRGSCSKVAARIVPYEKCALKRTVKLWASSPRVAELETVPRGPNEEVHDRRLARRAT